MKDLIKKTEKELVNLLKEKQTALRNFHFSLSGSKTRNVKEGIMLRKEIARIFTVINQKKAEVK
jgi:ribosomal protein L29